ncbi:MAG TPA: hypothetical protein VHR41_13555 [Gemmatimonadales bacterium]|nr:hypothetical protein [Gemmatimonadales bacterium]
MGLCAIMSVEIVLFTVVTFAPTGGHPSFEALGLVWTGVLKVVLAPAAVIALANGEKISRIVLGVTCVVCESVYTLIYPGHPFLWLLLRRGSGAS